MLAVTYTPTGNSLSVKAQNNLTEGLIAVGDIEVDFVSDLRSALSLSSLGEEEEDSGKHHQEANQNTLNGRHVV
jgi:hypothetical protein